MRKGTDILGKSVIAYATGERIGRVQDLIFDQDENVLLGFLIHEARLFRRAQIIPLSAVQAVGLDAIVVPDETALVSAATDERISAVLKQRLVLKGSRVVTTDGRYLGTIVDLFFDNRTGSVEGYEASGGLFADAYSGRSFIPAPSTIRIGQTFTFVPPETAALMEEQVGGVRGAVQIAGTKVQESAEAASRQLQDAASAASQQIQDAASAAGQNLQQFSAEANDRFDRASQKAIADIANRLADPEEQLAYVIGKPVNRDITSPDGRIILVKDETVTPLLAKEAQQLGVLDQVYQATGGLTTTIQHRFQETTEQAESRLRAIAQNGKARLTDAVSRLNVEQAKGHRVRYTVRGEDGLIVAAAGQIVTDPVIQRAQDHHREALLLDAVGVQPSEAARAQANGLLADTQARLRDGAIAAQTNANMFWYTLKHELKDLQKRTMRAIHRHRIEHALGRPVSRVILDPQDNVILNTGELITHHAIQQAEESGVLNILLNSVYAKTPQISQAELRAPESGTAALEPERELIVR